MKAGVLLSYIRFITIMYRRKTELIFGSILFIGVLFLLLFYSLSSYQQFSEEYERKFIMTSEALLLFPNAEIEEQEPDDQKLYESLLKQKRLIAQQSNAETFEDVARYNQASLELADEQIALYEEDNFYKVENYVLPQYQLELERQEYLTLQGTETESYHFSFNLIWILKVALPFITLALFVLLSLMCSEPVTEDRRHRSVLDGFPLTAPQRMLKKFQFILGVMIAILLLVFIAILGFNAIFGSFSTDYPMAVYLQQTFRTIPVWRYLGLYLLHTLFVFFVIMSLAVLLNLLTENNLLTIFLLALLFTISTLKPTYLPNSSFWLGIDSLNFFTLTNGIYPQTIGLFSLNLLFLAGLSIVGYLVLQSMLLKEENR